VLLLVAIAALASYDTWLQSRVVAAGAVALPVALWAWKYQRGYRRQDQSRHNIDPFTASFLLTTSVLSATILAATALPAHSVMGTASALGWSGIALAGELLLGRRVHEKKLWAAYHTQRAWFELNRDGVVSAGGFAP
jgi:hypothetical protein